MNGYSEYLEAGRPISALMENYIRHAPNPSFGPDSDFWSFDELLEFPESEPEKVWSCLLVLLSNPEYEPARGLFSAGPLEDVLSYHGELLIDRVESLASTSPEFIEMLSGMYQCKMTDAIWSRVQRLCGR